MWCFMLVKPSALMQIYIVFCNYWPFLISQSINGFCVLYIICSKSFCQYTIICLVIFKWTLPRSVFTLTKSGVGHVVELCTICSGDGVSCVLEEWDYLVTTNQPKYTHEACRQSLSTTQLKVFAFHLNIYFKESRKRDVSKFVLINNKQKHSGMNYSILLSVLNMENPLPTPILHIIW